MITGSYPNLRLRRSRKNDWSRRLIQENSLSSSDFILPIFLIDGKNKKQSIKTMPGVFRYSIDKIGHIVDKAIKNKIPMVALFPYTNSKLKNEIGNGLPLSYIFCTNPVYESLESSREVVRKNKWPIFELHAGHNAMYTHAKETLNLLMKICN